MTPLDDLQAVRLRRLLEEGLPLEASPYRLLAERIGATEDRVLAQVQQWQRDGLFRRVGLVLKADLRPGFGGQLTAKVDRVRALLDDRPEG